MLALTATSGPSSRRKIMKQLCFTANAEVIVESPDRNNIKISSKCIPNNYRFESVFAWLLDNMKTMKEKMPRHVIFCETISDVAKLFSEFSKHFGTKCEWIDMFHSKTNDKVKDKIRNDMTIDGKIRLLICTNSAGMGVNFHGLHNIIHYGLPREMDTFVQQMGRCGRDGEFSNELILYKNHKGHLKKVESDLVKLAKNDSECRRYILCNAYLLDKTVISPIHNCCDICEKNCKCGEEICPNKHAASQYTEEDTQDEEMERDVSSQERRLLEQKLNALKYQWSIDVQTLIHSDIIHGLTQEAISDIVDKCAKIFTPDDVMKYCQVWSYETAITVCNIICDIFGDVEMYEMDTDSE